MTNEDFFGSSAAEDTLATSLGDATEMAAGFRAELERVSGSFSAAGADALALEKGLSRGLKRAFTDLAVDGESLSDALESLAKSMIRTTYNAALKPVTDQVGGLLTDGLSSVLGGVLPFAEGGAFSSGKVMPFARGGVVSSPTYFPMRGGTGLMGEAGPEAILPLARGADGRLGVRAGGAGGVPTVVMNISTPDVAGFERARGQVAAQMSRAMARGNRNR